MMVLQRVANRQIGILERWKQRFRALEACCCVTHTPHNHRKSDDDSVDLFNHRPVTGPQRVSCIDRWAREWCGVTAGEKNVVVGCRKNSSLRVPFLVLPSTARKCKYRRQDHGSEGNAGWLQGHHDWICVRASHLFCSTLLNAACAGCVMNLLRLRHVVRLPSTLLHTRISDLSLFDCHFPSLPIQRKHGDLDCTRSVNSCCTTSPAIHDRRSGDLTAPMKFHLPIGSEPPPDELKPL